MEKLKNEGKNIQKYLKKDKKDNDSMMNKGNRFIKKFFN